MATTVTLEQLQDVQRKMSDRIEGMEEKVDAMFLACTKLFGEAVPAHLKNIADKIEEEKASKGVIVKEKVGMVHYWLKLQNCLIQW